MSGTFPLLSAKIIKYNPFFITYIRIGILLHIITILELGLLAIFLLEADLFLWLSSGWLPVKILILGYLLCLPVFAQLDVRSRFQNYKQAKDQLYVHGFRTRILYPFLKSRCQRDAVSVAADELGYGAAAKAFFAEKGCRWYHLLPEFSFRRPQFMLTKYFWINTFFMKDYKARFNYKQLYLEQQEAYFNVMKVWNSRSCQFCNYQLWPTNSLKGCPVLMHFQKSCVWLFKHWNYYHWMNYKLSSR
mgnify:CR=1 FL=1